MPTRQKSKSNTYKEEKILDREQVGKLHYCLFFYSRKIKKARNLLDLRSSGMLLSVD
jgi:hypothetical protein